MRSKSKDAIPLVAVGLPLHTVTSHESLASSDYNSLYVATDSNVSATEFVCDRCRKHFDAAADLSTHWKAAHGQRATARASFTCSKCSSKFQSEQFLVIHQRIHAAPRPSSPSNATATHTLVASAGDTLVASVGAAIVTARGPAISSDAVTSSSQQTVDSSDTVAGALPVAIIASQLSQEASTMLRTAGVAQEAAALR